jgi:hypothetical protein
MRLLAKLRAFFQPRPLTRRGILQAFIVAVCADGLQLLLGPLGWTFADQIIDAGAMVLTMRLIGFHILLLPTLVVELIPVVEDLPTWTACVAVVIALRRRAPAPAKSD